jgi:hypothetical protein
MIPMTTPSRGPGCASDVDLDEILSGEPTGSAREVRVRAHLATCPRCRERLAAFTAVDPPPASVMRARIYGARLGPPAPRRRRWLGAGAAFAAAAAALVLAWRLGPRPGGPGDERSKGALGLTVLVKRAGGAIDSVVQEGRLRAGDEMRFSLAPSRAGYAVVMGLDAAPSVTVYAPAASASAPIHVEATGSTTLPGSIVADETPGIERIVALVCAAATPPDELRRRAEAALERAHGQPERVTTLGTGCLEDSVVMRKEIGSP